MFDSKTKFEKLTTEVLVNIASFLSVTSILQFSLTAKAFRHLITDELVFRQLIQREYRVALEEEQEEEKKPEQTWIDYYKQLGSTQQQKEKPTTEKEQEQVTMNTNTEASEQPESVVATTATPIAETQEETIVQEEPTAAAATAVVEQVVEEDIVMEEVSTKTEEQAEQEVTPAAETTTVTTESEPIVQEEGKAEVKAEEPQQEQQQQQEEEKEAEDIETTTTSALENTNNQKEGGCPHLDKVSGVANEVKRILYKVENPSLCDICLTSIASYLNMSDTCHDAACRSCLDKITTDENTSDNEQYFPIQLELSSGELYCFKCGQPPHQLTEQQDSEKVRSILDYIKSPESEEDMDKRRKAEQQLYVQELRREDMSLKHYLVEKQWGRTWMLFRTREGSPLPGKITNNKLARMNGTLDPNIRLPMDKYRPSPETHGDIVSERLWSYLVKAYGVQGRAYSEDDIIAPEYARLRVYVDDFKKSIHLYP